MSTAFDEILTAFDKAMDLIDPPKTSDWTPLPHQVAPDWHWYVWLLMGGRGSGKTAASAKYIHDHVHGPPCLPDVPGGHWVSIVAPTLGDAVTSCVEGPSGLRAHDRGIKVLNRPGGIIARWSNGCEAKLFGAHSPEDVERFRAGGNRCIVWAEELAAWRYLTESWQQIRYGLRVGPWPRIVASTTPRPKALIKELVRDNEKVAVTKASTDDNPFLHGEVREALYKDFAGSRMGRQELAGELLEDIEGALWTGDLIEMFRIPEDMGPEWYSRKVVAVDPAASFTETADETGIIVCGKENQYSPLGWRQNLLREFEPHAFVIEDCSMKGTPTQWARRAIRAYRDHECDLIVAEKNNGGDMVKTTIHSVDASMPVKLVNASRGKAKRAEPVSTLYEEGRVHHLGLFPKLEDQMTSWDPANPDEGDSPDHMDALVWGITELMIGTGILRQKVMNDTRLNGRR